MALGDGKSSQEGLNTGNIFKKPSRLTDSIGEKNPLKGTYQDVLKKKPQSQVNKIKSPLRRK
jgi:hypothetical protein